MSKKTVFLYCLCIFSSITLTGCGKGADFLNYNKAIPLAVEKVDPKDIPSTTGDSSTTNDPTQPYPGTSVNGLHPIFSGNLGIAYASSTMGVVDSDPTGLNALNDYDGDSIPNAEEVISNPYVADYPRIVTRIGVPITMELIYEDEGVSKTHTEMVDDADVKNTITNSMEDRHYNMLNLKTTPYEVQNDSSFSRKNAGSYGYSMNNNIKVSASVNAAVFNMDTNTDISLNTSTNRSWEHSLASSSSSRKTVFDDISYIDNMDRSGSEMKDDTIERVSRNYRNSRVSDTTVTLGPNAGVVRAALYIKNPTVNMPVRVSNVYCTLSFKTPAGKLLAVQTFKLRNADYSEFDQEIYGGQELGPYTVDVDGLSTFEVKKALRYGYIPQIHVVSYDMNRVQDSNYNPGVDNLKIVEEIVKARTATIKIIGNGMRETHRVTAFDVDSSGNVTPGISLKKALFRIMQSRTGNGESWDADSEGAELTVPDSGLQWKNVPEGETREEHIYSANQTGNSWDKFSTYVKSFVTIDRDASGNLIEKVNRIETIASIGHLKKYNPFSVQDNPNYSPNEPLSEDDFLKLKYWIILHNGEYFKGDINDPIWAGERFEVIMYDAKDFNARRESFHYTPLQNASTQEMEGPSIDFGSGSSSSWGGSMTNTAIETYADFTLNTMWNRLFDEGDFARSVYLGKITRGDVIKLEVELEEFRSLFDVNKPGTEFDRSVKLNQLDGNIWHKFNYTFDTGEEVVTGMPGDFSFDVWGGTNQLRLWVDKSEKAHYYTVAFWRAGETEADARTAKIDADDLKENNNFITISRISKDESGNSVGELDANDYRIKVRAHGIAYNVPVSVLSTQGIRTVTVEDPDADVWPAPFSISATGDENVMTVRIGQTNNAEFYAIDITGPYNYGFDNGSDAMNKPPVKRVIGHGGDNIIKIPNLTSATFGSVVELTDDEKEFKVPGVYRVQVYAANRNTLDVNGNVNDSNTTEAMGDPQVVMINYHRFADQKALMAKKQLAQFDPKDVDFEVNFNEGSGWFKLKLGHNDIADEDREIDCRYTTSFVQNRERVTIFFTAPTTGDDAPQNNVYNVFRGGTEEVEVYLRTVAKPEYRDCLWLKPNRADMLDAETESVFNPEMSRYLNINESINSLPEYDPLVYWMMNTYTDVSYIDEYDGDVGFFDTNRVFTSLSSIDVASGDFGIIAKNGMDDFFFSPMKRLTYNISASIVEVDLAYLIGEVTHVDNPEFKAMGGEKSIIVTDVDSQYADAYDLYWKEGVHTDVPDIANGWDAVTISGADHGFQIGEPDTATELLENQVYTLCMIARNSTSTSSPVFKQVSTASDVGIYYLIDPGFYSHGAGQFADPVAPITRDTGLDIVAGTDFVYGESLLGGAYDLYDMGSGLLTPFAPGKYFRIVNSGKNIADSSGLDLLPVAYDLTQLVSPKGDECYIDPVNGKFVLPRPDYWSKLEDLANIDNPELGYTGSMLPTYTSSGTTSGAGTASYNQYFVPNPTKFANGLQNFATANCGYASSASASRTTVLNPLGSTETLDFSAGTFSVWGTANSAGTHQDSANGSWSSSANSDFGFPDQSGLWVRFTSIDNYGGTVTQYVELYVGGIQIGTAGIGDDAVFHLYVQWDNNGINGGADTVRVYINGVLSISTTNTLPDLTAVTPRIDMYSAATCSTGLICSISTYSYTEIDNLKIWNDSVGPNADWEYNSGAGREDALHAVYEESDGYRPNLFFSYDGDNTNDGGVGFYYVPQY